MFNEAFPQYLAIGMTYDEYWHGDPSLARAYRKAYAMRRDERNWELWMQGMYVYTALLCVAPVMRAFTKGHVEPGKYPDEPFPITEQQARDQEVARQKANFDKMIAEMNALSERELKRRNETKEVGADA